MIPFMVSFIQSLKNKKNPLFSWFPLGKSENVVTKGASRELVMFYFLIWMMITPEYSRCGN